RLGQFVIRQRSLHSLNYARIQASESQMNFRWVAALAGTCVLAISTFAAAEDKVSFQGEIIKMIVPTTTGGSTDIAARLIAQGLGKNLPGNPKVVIQNMPGGHGVAALNYVTQQAKP